MNYNARKKLYAQIEGERETKVLAFVTSDRVGMESKIAQDSVDLFVDLLDQIGPTKRISLLLHTSGGDTLAAWRIANLITMFCDELEVLIPMKALSAGTLISIGADHLVMTKQATLGPIDPSVNNPLNPHVNVGGQAKQVPVSVEAVRGYLDAAREELKIKGDASLTTILVNLASHVHPLVLGQIFRSQAQIRFLAEKLIQRQVTDKGKIKSIINFLCAETGSHDYTINRREASELGLNIQKPSEKFYRLLRKIHLSYAGELKLLSPYSQQAVLGTTAVGTPVNYTEVRGLIESTEGGCHGFVSDGTLTKVQVQTPTGPQDGIQDNRTFEGWRELK